MTETKRVYTVEHFELLDGTKVEAKPLPIKRLRTAQAAIREVFKTAEEQNEDSGEATDDALMDACVDIVLSTMRNQKSCEKFLEPDNGRELLEDSLDQDTMYEIVRVATGFDFLAMQKNAQKMMEMENL